MSVAGSWILKIDSKVTPRPFDLIIVDKGAGSFEGYIHEQGNPNPPERFAVTVTGNQIIWNTTKPIAITYEGTVNGDTINGEVSTQAGKARFEAKKVK
jgi:hypothetical protein